MRQPADRQDGTGRFLSHPLFKNLSPQVRSDLAGKIISRRIYPGTVVFSQHDISDSLYYIAQGSVELKSISPEGKEIIFSRLNDNELFGEAGFLDGRPREIHACATALTDLLILPRTGFIRIMNDMNALAWFQALYLVTDRYRKTISSLETTALLKPQQILARKLVELFSGRDILKISHEKLAGMTGLRREAIGKLLSDLEKDGLIVKAHSQIRIGNAARLQACAAGELDEG